MSKSLIKWCNYCQKNTHNDSECWSTRPVRTNGLTDTYKAALYDELIFAVYRKFPDESRHQTALRYIRQAEESNLKVEKSESPKENP